MPPYSPNRMWHPALTTRQSSRAFPPILDGSVSILLERQEGTFDLLMSFGILDVAIESDASPNFPAFYCIQTSSPLAREMALLGTPLWPKATPPAVNMTFERQSSEKDPARATRSRRPR